MNCRWKRTIAWVLLLLFCSMTGIKSVHHHHHGGDCGCDVCCTHDISSSHSAHDPTQIYEWEEEAACLLCQFCISKVTLPTIQHYIAGTPAQFLHVEYILPYCFTQLQGISLLRAPPAAL